MTRLKVATVLGTRPEIIRLSATIRRLDEVADHCLIHTGQNFDHELNEALFADLGVRAPDHYLEAAGGSAAQTVGNVIVKSDALLRSLQPDAVLILGDTNSCMAAISAKRLKIPVFHMEAGNRCFDDRVPEEINRRIVDHVADINLPYSDRARDNLLREGFAPDRIIKTGSPMREVLNDHRDRIQASTIVDTLQLTSKAYFVVSAHREENLENPALFARLCESLNALVQGYDIPVIVSAHPRLRRRIETAGYSFDARVRMMRPLTFTDYVKLQQNARAVLSDSGTITEEAAILGLPALSLRETHERMEGMEEAAAMMVGLDSQRIMQGLAILASAPEARPGATGEVPDYAAANVSEKVVRVLHSYVDYVRRVVWRAAV